MNLVSRLCAASLTTIAVASLIEMARGESFVSINVFIAALSFLAWDVFRDVYPIRKNNED